MHMSTLSDEEVKIDCVEGLDPNDDSVNVKFAKLCKSNTDEDKIDFQLNTLQD